MFFILLITLTLWFQPDLLRCWIFAIQRWACVVWWFNILLCRYYIDQKIWIYGRFSWQKCAIHPISNDTLLSIYFGVIIVTAFCLIWIGFCFPPARACNAADIFDIVFYVAYYATLIGFRKCFLSLRSRVSNMATE